jgi:hypothetical protein
LQHPKRLTEGGHRWRRAVMINTVYMHSGAGAISDHKGAGAISEHRDGIHAP